MTTISDKLIDGAKGGAAESIRFTPKTVRTAGADGIVGPVPTSVTVDATTGAFTTVDLVPGPYEVRIKWRSVAMAETYPIAVPETGAGIELWPLIAAYVALPPDTPMELIVKYFEAHPVEGIGLDDTGIAALVDNPTSEVKTTLDGHYAPVWQASKAYAAGDAVLLPDGSTGTRVASGVSRETFDSIEYALWLIGARFIRKGTAAPLAKLAPLSPMKEVGEEARVPPSGYELVIADVTGSGTVHSIWIASSIGQGDPAAYQDMRLRVFVDGERTASVDVDFASLFLTGYEAAKAGFFAGTDHVHAEMAEFPNNKFSGVFKFPIPYGDGCRIIVKNESSVSGSMFSQVRYQPGETSDYRLKSICQPTANAVRLTKDDTWELFSTPANNPGWLVYFGYAAQSLEDATVDGSFLERNIAFTVDGESTPGIETTGTEDLFLSGWYFGGRMFPGGRNYRPWMALSRIAASSSEPHATAVVSVDLLAQNGGLPFTQSMSALLKTEANCVVGHQFGFTALFYTLRDAAWGTPSIANRPPTPPTDVKAFLHGARKVVVTWSPPASDGSSSVTGYRVTAVPEGNTVTVGDNIRAAVLSSLYIANTFTVTALSPDGDSAASAPSESVTAVVRSNDPSSVGLMQGWWRADSALQYGIPEGRPIAFLPDLSGQRRHLRQQMTKLAPTLLAAGIAGKPTLDFTPGQNLGTPNITGSGTGDAGNATLHFVVKSPSVITSGRTVIGGAGTWYVGVNPSGNLVVNCGGGERGAVPVSPDTVYVITVINGTAANVWVNGVAGTAGNAGLNQITQLWLNSRKDSLGGTQTDWDFSEVLLYNRLSNLATRTNIEQYLATEYNVNGWTAPTI